MTKFSIGIDLGGSHITAALVDQNGRIKARKKIYFTKAPNGKQGLRLIAQLVRSTLYALRSTPTGLGLACPGSVDSERGIVLADSPNLIGWKGTKVKQELEKALKIPVFIDNDANLAAWGEKCWGAGKGARNLICLTLGTGVGGGIIIDNKIYRGSHFYAAEIGHMFIVSGANLLGDPNIP
ncbi:MAG: ROK family protein, partial [Planctomycetota bacterium]